MSDPVYQTITQADLLMNMRLSGGQAMARGDLEYMVSWFDEHEHERDGMPWLLRGGEAARQWAREQLDNCKALQPKPKPLPDGRDLVPILRKVFKDQESAVLNGLSGLKAVPDLPDSFIPLDRWDDTLADAVKPVLEVMMSDESRQMLTRIGASPDVSSVVNQKLPEAVESLSLQFAKSTNQTTAMELDDALNKLRTDLEEGLTVGDTRIELRNRVQEVFHKANDSRAVMIAETEASRAVHRADIISAKESNLVSGKSWLASSDACPLCLEIVEQNPDPIPLDKLFADVGGEYGQIDGPPRHPRCQCSLRLHTEDAPIVAHEPGAEGGATSASPG